MHSLGGRLQGVFTLWVLDVGGSRNVFGFREHLKVPSWLAGEGSSSLGRWSAFVIPRLHPGSGANFGVWGSGRRTDNILGIVIPFLFLWSGGTLTFANQTGARWGRGAGNRLGSHKTLRLRVRDGVWRRQIVGLRQWVAGAGVDCGVTGCEGCVVGGSRKIGASISHLTGTPDALGDVFTTIVWGLGYGFTKEYSSVVVGEVGMINVPKDRVVSERPTIRACRLGALGKMVFDGGEGSVPVASQGGE